MCIAKFGQSPVDLISKGHNTGYNSFQSQDAIKSILIL